MLEKEPLGMPKFSTYNDSVTRTEAAMYFCSDEEVSIDNVKIGTFRSAKKHCGKILTPRICDNKSLAETIRDLAIKAQEGVQLLSFKDLQYSINCSPYSVHLLTRSVDSKYLGFDSLQLDTFRPTPSLGYKLWTGSTRVGHNQFVDENGLPIENLACYFHQTTSKTDIFIFPSEMTAYVSEAQILWQNSIPAAEPHGQCLCYKRFFFTPEAVIFGVGLILTSVIAIIILILQLT